jgi:prepilin-type N-terminal cleavage/methylation domain-containing protein
VKPQCARARPSDHRSPITDHSVRAGFTLLELLIVIGIIGLLMVLLVPAFTSLRSGTDVTSAASTIKGALDTARTYAKANNTYVWMGFYEEDPSEPPATRGNGRLVMSIVASKDGTNVAGTSGTIDATKLIQAGKLTKIENVHLPLFAVCQVNCTGDTFDKRPPLHDDGFSAGYNYSRFGELNAPQPNTAPYTTPHDFQYPVGDPAPTAQYTFTKILQFSPRGESRVNGDSYQVRRVVEIGLVPTHGNTVPPGTGSGSSMTYSGNVAAVQIAGFGSSVKIYQR